MDTKVSIIVPIYNTEGELRKCLNSILRQTYKNWNCLLINDGSTDSSGSICDEYSNKDSRFIVYHKKNEGEGPARNYGLEYADGEFIAFIDSDDWIEDNYLEFLLSKVNDEIDMVMCHAIFEYNDSSVEVLKIKPDVINCTKENKRDYILSSINRGYAKNILHEEQGFLNTVWGKIYRRKVIEENSIRFSNLKLNADEIFNLYFFHNSKEFVIYNVILYHYFMRNSSAVHSFKPNHKEIYKEFYTELLRFINQYYKLEGDFEGSYYSAVATSLFNITKDYFFNPEYVDRVQRKKEMKQIIDTQPYKDALKNFDRSISKNREVIFVSYIYKFRLFVLLDVYFKLRSKLKLLAILFRKNVTRKSF